MKTKRKKILKVIFWPLVLLRRAHDAILCKYNPEKLFCLRYKRIYGVPLHSKEPKNLYDYIAYMAFHTDTTLWSRLADKIAVREYVEEKGYGFMLTRLYGVYDCAEDINYDVLPSAFILKTNNASATNILVRDKSKIDKIQINRQLNKWLTIDYGYRTCQPHYSRIRPRILCEELLVDNETTLKGKMLVDYKFYCIGGEPLFVQVLTDREECTHKIKIALYDMEWKLHTEYLLKSNEWNLSVIDKPKSFDKMKEAAKIFSKNIPFLRIDFYEINGKPYFGELTFTPGLDTMNVHFFNDMGKIIGKQLILK